MVNMQGTQPETQEGTRDCKTTKALLQAQGSKPVEHPHRVCSFSALIKYFQIKTRQILVRLQF